MKEKKGVMGIYWVVAAAIALIILLFMIYMSKVGIGGGVVDMLNIQKEVTNDIEKERISCQNACIMTTGNKYEEIDQWRSSSYCMRSANLDLNGDGEISKEDGERGIRCWDSEGAHVFCEGEMKDGTPVSYCACEPEACCGIGCTGEMDCSNADVDTRAECGNCTGDIDCWDPGDTDGDGDIDCDLDVAGCNPVNEICGDIYIQDDCNDVGDGNCHWGQQEWNIYNDECD